MPYTVTLKGQLGLGIQAGPNGKSIEITQVKPGLAADEWNTVAFVEGDDALVIGVGDVIKALDKIEVMGMSFDDTKSILAKMSKENKDFKITFYRQGELPASSGSSAAPASPKAAAAPSGGNTYEVTVKGSLAIGIRAGPGGKSLEVTEVKAGGAAEAWNKTASAGTKIEIGDVIAGLGSDDVANKSYDDVKAMLVTKSKSGSDFTIRFARKGGASSAAASPAPAAAAAVSSSSGAASPVTFEITAKGGLLIGIKAGPSGKSIEVTEIKSGGAAEAWNKANPSSQISVGDVIASICGDIVINKSYDDVKASLVTQSKSGKEFKVGFSSKNTPAAAAAVTPASAAAPATPAPTSSPAPPQADNEYQVTVKGGLSIGIKAGPGGKSLEVTEVKPGGAAEAWNKTASAANRIASGHVVVGLGDNDVRSKPYEDVKALLVTNSKSGSEFVVRFAKPAEEGGATSTSGAAASSSASPSVSCSYTATVKGSLLIGIKAGPNGKSLEVTEVKSGGAADQWNKDVDEQDRSFAPGDVIQSLDGSDVSNKSYDDVKALLGKFAKSNQSYSMGMNYSAARSARIAARKEALESAANEFTGGPARPDLLDDDDAMFGSSGSAPATAPAPSPSPAPAAPASAPSATVDSQAPSQPSQPQSQPQPQSQSQSQSVAAQEAGVTQALDTPALLQTVDALLARVMPFAPSALDASTGLATFDASGLGLDSIDLSEPRFAAL